MNLSAGHIPDSLNRIVEAADDASVLGIRLGVKNGGCAGMSYTLDLAREAQPHVLVAIASHALLAELAPEQMPRLGSADIWVSLPPRSLQVFA